MIAPQIQDYLKSSKTTDSFSNLYKINDLSKLINTKGSTKNDILSLGIIDTNNI